MRKIPERNTSDYSTLGMAVQYLRVGVYEYNHRP